MTGTIYPLGIDGLTQLPRVVDGVNPILADDVNRVRDAVVAVEKELGINPSGTYGTVRARLDALDSLIALLPDTEPNPNTSIMLDYLSVGLEQPTSKTYNLVTNIPYDGYIFSVASKCNAGTASAEILINGTPLGGGSNSVSTTQDVVFHASDRTFVPGDDIQLTMSAVTGATDVVITVVYLRFVEIAGGGGGGDGYVQSIASSGLDNSLARFDGATGLVINDSSVILTDGNVMTDLAGLGIGLSSPSSTLHVDGSLAMGITTISSGPSTLTAGYSYVLADANFSGFTINLPLASTCAGRTYNIKKIDATANVVTISRTGGDTIDGVATHTLTIQYQSLTFASNGSDWFIF